MFSFVVELTIVVFLSDRAHPKEHQTAAAHSECCSSGCEKKKKNNRTILFTFDYDLDTEYTLNICYGSTKKVML